MQYVITMNDKLPEASREKETTFCLGPSITRPAAEGDDLCCT
ncbi:hypothetical protein [Brevibacillus sp. SIMBA_076]